jgi:hypothetical protein
LDSDGVCDVEEVYGCDDPSALNFNAVATEDDGSCNYDSEVPEGFDVIPGPSSASVLGQVLLDGMPASGLDWVGAYTPAGICAGATSLFMHEGAAYMNLTVYGDDATSPDLVEGMVSGEPFTLRLFDASSGQTIAYNAGQLFYGWLNTNGGALPGYANPETVYAFVTPDCPDLDGDGICNDEDDCPGAQLDALGVCGGECPSDYNSNGICDSNDVPGCTYVDALNFNPLATLDTGICVFDECDCTGSGGTGGYGGTEGCLGDFNNDGIVGVSDILQILAVFDTACE